MIFRAAASFYLAVFACIAVRIAEADVTVHGSVTQVFDFSSQGDGFGFSDGAFELMPEATFATFNSFVGMTSSYEELASDSLLSLGSNLSLPSLHWEGAGGELLTTQIVSNGVTNTVQLIGSSGVQYDPAVSGGAVLVYDSTDSIIGYLSNFSGAFLNGLSNDGVNVVGGDWDQGDAFIWRIENGIQSINLLGDYSSSAVHGVAADGRVIGWLYSDTDFSLSNNLEDYGSHGFLWDESHGYEILENVPSDGRACTSGWSGEAYRCDTYGVGTMPTAISTDGRVIVGKAMMVDRWSLSIGDLAGALYFQAFRWTSDGGSESLGSLSGGAKWSAAHALNSDGSVVVGAASSSNGTEAFRWTATDGMIGLGDLAGGRFYSSALSVDSSGNRVVGFGDVGAAAGSQPIYEAFLWQSSTGLVGLGRPLGGSTSSLATAISADGNVIVGGYGDLETKDMHAFRWTEVAGMQTVTDWLVQTGARVPSGYSLQMATVVDADGSVIGGLDNGEAWLAIAGRGVIYPATYTPSILTPLTMPSVGISLNGLSMNGAHHRPLKTLELKKPEECFWVNGDFADYDRKHAEVSLAEVGFCRDFNAQTRAGFGLGKSFTRQRMPNQDATDLDGIYLYGEIGHAADGLPIISTASFLFGNWDGSSVRHYANMGVTDWSEGKPEVDSASVRFRLDWMDFGRVGDFSISPKIEWSYSESKVDGYAETGGGFPARFDDYKTISKELRAGFSATRSISEHADLRLMAEQVHRFDQSRAAMTGEIIGLMDFSVDPDPVERDWTRFGAEFDYRLADGVLISGMLMLSPEGEDADKSAAITLKWGF
jgi:probable HAF family extracellular repeat protein